MQNREKKINGEELHQAIHYFLRKSYEDKIFNFTLKLSGSSSLMPIETLISTRFYAKQLNAHPIATEFKNAQEHLENAAPSCGSFAKGFFKFLTGIDSNLYTQPPYKTTHELRTLVKEKNEFPYTIHLYLPQHIYTILVTERSKDGKPQGYIYQTNTAKEMAGEKFSIQHWIMSPKNTIIDVLDHLLKIDILIDHAQRHDLKKKIYEMLFTIPISEEVITLKNLDQLVTIPKGIVRWNIGNVSHHALEKLSALYQASIEELSQLKTFFGIPQENDFVTMFSRKLQNDEITLEEDPDLKTALTSFIERRNVATPISLQHPNSIKNSKPTYMYGYSYFGGVDSDSENEEKLTEVTSLDTSTTTKQSNELSSPRTHR